MQSLQSQKAAVYGGLILLMMGLGACSNADDSAANSKFADCRFLSLEDVYSDLESYFDQEICVDAFVEVEYEGMHLYYEGQPPTLIYDLHYGVDAPFGLQEAIEDGIYTGDRIRIRGRFVPFEPCRVRYASGGSSSGSHCMPYSPIHFEDPVYEIANQPPPMDICETASIHDLFERAEQLYRHPVCVTGTFHGGGESPVLVTNDATTISQPPISLRILRSIDVSLIEDGTQVTVSGWSYATHWCFTRDRDGYPPCDEEQLAPRIVVYDIARLE